MIGMFLLKVFQRHEEQDGVRLDIQLFHERLRLFIQFVRIGVRGVVLHLSRRMERDECAVFRQCLC